MKISMKSKEDKTLQQGFDEFIKLSKIKNLSNYTIIYYENCMNSFFKFTNEETFIRDINEDTISEFILYLKENTGYNDI
jgi:integrase/recombinase XerD